MSIQKVIEIKCTGADALDIKDIEPFQGNLKDLSKENYEKLKKEIFELGFSEPISVWKNKEKIYCLNGHQRLRTLRMMQEEGVLVPKIPVNYIQSKDIKEAKKKVLALTSQYGNMTSEGLYEFMNDSGLTMEEISASFRFPEIDLAVFNSEFFTETLSEEDAFENLKNSSHKDFMEMNFVIHESQVNDVKEAISKAVRFCNEEDVNKNKNGAALVYIFRRYLESQGN